MLEVFQLQCTKKQLPVPNTRVNHDGFFMSLAPKINLIFHSDIYAWEFC